MTALIIFMGISATCTLFLVAALALAARRTMPAAEAEADLTSVITLRTATGSATLNPAFNHQ